MTTKKLTDLTELTATAAGDFALVVDASDTTDDPAGSSRKVQIGNLLPNSGVSAGSYGDATHVPALTINAKGQVTAASSVAISGGGGGGITALTGDVTASGSGSVSTTVTKINGQAPATVATTGAYADLTGRPTFATIATTGGTTTLTTTQAQNYHLDVTGTLTSDATIVFPSGQAAKCSISNSTSAVAGGDGNHGYFAQYNVRAKVAGQSNYVYISPGLSKEIYSDGTTLKADASESAGASLAFNYSDWAGTQDVTITDQTTLLQNFLLYCQLEALRLKARVITDQAQRICVRAYIPDGAWYVTSPIIVPPYVELYCDGVLYRGSTAGTPTNNYNGNPSSNALINLAQPVLIVTPGGHCTRVSIYDNPDGTHVGSGMFVGKNWTVASFAVGAAGSGYSVGDSLYAYNPSISPYSSAGATVASVNGSGGVTGVTFVGGGAYELPPYLQAQQWTAANGFSVFDGSGNFLTTTGGVGMGCTLAPTWTTDWGTGTAYNGGNGGLVQDTMIDNIRVISAGITTDATYGPTYGVQFYGLNFNVGEVEVNGGYHGIWFNRAVDVRADRLNAVSGFNLMTIQNGGDINCPDVVLDTCFGGAFLNLDQTSNIVLRGQMFNNGSGTVGTSAAVMIGANSSSTPVTGTTLDFAMQDCGTSGGIPALSLAYCDSNCFDFRVTNEAYTGSPDALQNNAFAAFGAGVGTGNDIRGSIDHCTGSIFTGTIPNCGVRVVDAVATGDAARLGLYSISASGAPASGVTGANKAPLGSSYTDTSTGLRYTNTGTKGSPTWTASGGGTPGGSPGQLQYNNSGSFGGATVGAGLAFASGSLASNAGLFGVKDAAYGALGNGRKLTDVTTNASSAVISSGSYSFAGTDVGKYITIAGAGTSGAVLNATIAAVSSGAATLSKTAGTSIAGAAVATFGTDDTAAIQAAINAASSAGGGLVTLPSGIYIVTGSLTWASKVSMKGNGAGKSVLKFISPSDMTAGVIVGLSGSYTNPYTDCQFADFEIDCDAATMATPTYLGKAIYMQYLLRPVFRNLFLHGSPATALGADFMQEACIADNVIENAGRLSPPTGGAGIGIGVGGNAAFPESYSVTGNKVANAYKFGIFFETQTGSVVNFARADVVGNTVVAGANSQYGIGDCGLTGLVCTGNTVVGSSTSFDGICVRTGTLGGKAGVQGLIANNAILGAGGNGISIDYAATGANPGQLCGYQIVGNNILNSLGGGIALLPGATAMNTVTIADNTISGSGGAGVIIASGAGGIADLTMANNQIYNNATATATSTRKCGISFNAAVTRARITENACFDNAGGTQLYGMIFNGVAVTGVIARNNLGSNATGAFSSVSATLTGTLFERNIGSMRTAVADANYAAQPYDEVIAFTSLTAPRTLTLPATPAGKGFTIADEGGNAGAYNVALSATIDGATTRSLASAHAALSVYSNGTSYATSGGSDPNLAPAAIVAGISTASQYSPPVVMQYSGTITKATMQGLNASNALTSGSAVMDVLKNGSSIAAGDKPTLSSASSSTDTALTGWTTTFAAGDVFQFLLNSISTIATAQCTLSVTKG